MKQIAPHVIPYQGSKRKLAEEILEYADFPINVLYEPFAGSAAITLAAANRGMAKQFVIADKLEPLAELWTLIIEQPDYLIRRYAHIWNEQLSNPAEYYLKIREEFNQTKDATLLLYLIARCVKNSIRFNSNGEFNQGADHRRLGLKPEKLEREIRLASQLLKGKTSAIAGDFIDVVDSATADDLVYMDPPWQGTSGKKDPRYAYLLDLDILIAQLEKLNKKKVPFILSFDGTCGDRTYGTELPDSLRLERVPLHAGRSSQATLLGRNEETIESLYLSPALIKKMSNGYKSKLKDNSKKEQLAIF